MPVRVARPLEALVELAGKGTYILVLGVGGNVCEKCKVGTGVGIALGDIDGLLEQVLDL